MTSSSLWRACLLPPAQCLFSLSIPNTHARDSVVYSERAAGALSECARAQLRKNTSRHMRSRGSGRTVFAAIIVIPLVRMLSFDRQLRRTRTQRHTSAEFTAAYADARDRPSRGQKERRASGGIKRFGRDRLRVLMHQETIRAPGCGNVVYTLDRAQIFTKCKSAADRICHSH